VEAAVKTIRIALSALIVAFPFVALAQTAAQPATTPNPAKPTAPMSADKQAKAAKSKECSMQADQKGLHGKARKTFRAECKRM
jgi:hypothetical protein